MNKLIEKATAARIALAAVAERAASRARDDEAGQGTVEYVGAVLLVVAVVGISCFIFITAPRRAPTIARIDRSCGPSQFSIHTPPIRIPSYSLLR